MFNFFCSKSEEISIPLLNYSRTQKAIAIVMIVIAFCVLWIWLIKPISDGDIWFHMLYGRYLVEHKTLIPDHTIYSWTPSTNEHIYCAWIGHILYYFLYELAGFKGIIIFRYIVVSSFLICLLWFSWKRNVLYHPATWFTAVLSIPILQAGSHDKPEMLSFIFITLFMLNWYCIKIGSDNVWKLAYTFPVLMLFWVNSHGGFIFGCLFLFCISIGEVLNQLIYTRNALPKKVFFHICIAFFLCFIAIFITPYGYKYIVQLLLNFYDSQLIEDLSIVDAYQGSFDTYFPYLTFFANTALLILILTFLPVLIKKQLDFVPIVLNLAFAFIFTAFTRSTYFWIPIFVLTVIYCMPINVFFQQSLKKVWTAPLILLFTVLISWAIIYQAKHHQFKGSWMGFGLDEMFAIEDEKKFLEESLIHYRLCNSYNHGAYLLWEMWPRVQVMMDARYFPYKKWYNHYMKIENSQDLFSQFPCDVAAFTLSELNVLKVFHQSKDWQLAFYSKGAAIYVKKSLGYNAPVKTGKGLDDIKSYGIAMDVLNFTFLIKDWQNAERALTMMERNFTCSKHIDTTAGFRYLLNAFRAYDDRNYFLAVELIDKAAQKEVKHLGKQFNALIMKAIDEWRGGDYLVALKDTIKANQTFPNFIASYNMAVMAWRLERLNPDFVSEMQLNETEAKLVSQSRQMFENIVKNEYKTSPQYLFFVDDARDILNGQADDKELIFIKPEDV